MRAVQIADFIKRLFFKKKPKRVFTPGNSGMNWIGRENKEVRGWAYDAPEVGDLFACTIKYGGACVFEIKTVTKSGCGEVYLASVEFIGKKESRKIVNSLAKLG